MLRLLVGSLRPTVDRLPGVYKAAVFTVFCSVSVYLSAVWPCFHHRYSSFTSQTRIPHLHALICVQIAPQITNLRTKTSVLYTPAIWQRCILDLLRTKVSRHAEVNI